MKKTKLTKLAAELGVPPEELLLRAQTLLKPEQYKGKSLHFTWLTPEAVDILRQHDAAPMTVAKRHNAFGVSQAPNPRYVWCTLDGISGRHPVAIPRKLQGKLVGKRFVAEAIEDTSGVTFRHELLGR